MPNKSNQDTAGKLWRRLRDSLHSSRGRDVLLFLLFLCVSYVFWIIMSLNDDMQQDLSVKLEIQNQPADVTFISNVPSAINVTLRDKGSTLAQMKWSGVPSLKIDFEDFNSDPLHDRLSLNEQELHSRVRQLFSAAAQVVSIRPDSLSLFYTDRPGVRVKVVADVNASPNAQSVISGPVTVYPDSVTVYSTRHLSASPALVHTVTINRSDLADTLVTEVNLRPEAGTRMIPDRVKLTIPVEPLITKERTVAVTLANAGSMRNNVVLFPSNVKVSYLVPMSMYKSESGFITVNADFSRRSGSAIPLSVGSLPAYFQGVTLSVDSVEYLIEQKSTMPTSDQ